MDDEAARTEEWRSMLTGENDTLKRLRRYWKLLPSSPRCKVCAAPFRGPGKLATSIIMHGQSKLNPDEAARREIEISGRAGLLEVVVDWPGLAVASTAA
jgi:hypothetical protein